jgi:hypothetical protein
MSNRAKSVPYMFTQKAMAELKIDLRTPLQKSLDQLVVLEEKREKAMNAWLNTPLKLTQEAGEAYAVLEALEVQISALASVIAFAWRQENQ